MPGDAHADPKAGHAHGRRRAKLFARRKHAAGERVEVETPDEDVPHPDPTGHPVLVDDGKLRLQIFHRRNAAGHLDRSDHRANRIVDWVLGQRVAKSQREPIGRTILRAELHYPLALIDAFEERQATGLDGGGTALWAGIDQYAYYRVNDAWAWGVRFEWFQDTNGTRVGLNRPGNPNHVPLPGNFYPLTLGPNWTPAGNLLMRPAFRWDFFGGPYGGPRAPFNDGISNQQTMLGFDMIQKFRMFSR